jgi:CHAT domain-containing protein
MKRVTIFIILLFCCLNLFGQQSSFEKAEKLYNSSQYSKAADVYKTAIKEVIATSNDTLKTLLTADRLYICLLTTNRILEFFPFISDIEPFTNFKNEQTIWVLIDIASVYDSYSMLELANNERNKAITLMNKWHTKGIEYQKGIIYNDIGVQARFIGDYARSLYNYHKSLSSFKQHLPFPKIDYINTASNIWNLYMLQKNYTKAAQFLPTLLSSLRQIKDKKSDVWGAFYLDYSYYLIHKTVPQPDSAIYYAQKAVKFFDANQISLDRPYRYLADAYAAGNFKNEAIKHYKLALQIASKANKTIQIAKNHEGLSKVYQSSNPMLALGHIQMALWSVGAPFRAKDFHKNPAANDFKFRAESIGILQQKVLILKQLYQQRRQTDYLKAAFATAKTIDQLIEKQRLTFLLETSKFELAETAHQASDQAIELAFELYQTTQQSSYLHEAFYFAERSRLFVLYESVRAARTPHFEGVPDSLIVAEQRWQRVMATEERKNISSTLLTQAIEKSEKLKAQFKANYPAYYQYRYEPQPIVIDQVQQSLSSKAALIEYFVGQAHVFIFVVRANACHLYRLAKTKKLETDITTFKQELQAGNDVNVLLNTGNQLYNSLYKNPVGNKINDIQTLTVVPDGFLNGLPFETLITRPNASLTQPTIFLIEQATIEYAQSATMRWRSPLPSAAVTGQISYTGFSPKYAQNDLPLNRALVASLADKLGGVSFLGTNANRSTFADISKNSPKLLHLSMHGGVGEEQTDNPFLLLNTAKGQADTLTANDIYGLRVQAQLVLLDACESGIGDLRTGEGTLNLARSFVYAGCPSVAMSYWKLTSNTQTQALIQFFSEKSIKNLTKSAEALQNAKLEYINQNRRSLQYIHPKFWSPIVVYVSSNQPTNHYRFWSIFGFIALIGVLYFALVNATTRIFMIK